MGNLVWHDWARFLSITACTYGVWASYWGMFYRKFFWDFVGGTLRDPGGTQAPASAAFFTNIIVKAPVVPIFTFLLGLFIIAMEYPVPIFKQLAIHRSLLLRVVLLMVQAILTILFYQGTNASIWSFVAAMAYARAIALGEVMEEAKANRGSFGAA